MQRRIALNCPKHPARRLPSVDDAVLNLRLQEVRAGDGVFDERWRVVDVDADRMERWHVLVVLVQQVHAA